jgi:hypothetical protein
MGCCCCCFCFCKLTCEPATQAALSACGVAYTKQNIHTIDLDDPYLSPVKASKQQLEK